MAQTRKTAVRPARPAASGKPFLRFYFPAALHEKVLGLLEKLETSPDPTKHRSALADVVVELTRCGMAAPQRLSVSRTMRQLMQ